jgi:dipeptidase E
MTTPRGAPQIVALGGIEGATPGTLDAYTFGLCGRTRPRVLLVPTGWGDDPETVREFDDLLSPLGEVSHLLLIDCVVPDLRSSVLAHDVVWVGGGDTRAMLRIWRECGLDVVLREAWEAGIVLTGVSAGGVCWFEDGLTRTADGLIPLGDGLGFLPGSFGVHDAVPDRREAYRRFVGEGRVQPGLAAADGVGVHFVGTEVHRIVSARAGACAYRVDAGEGRAVEHLLPTIELG